MGIKSVMIRGLLDRAGKPVRLNFPSDMPEAEIGRVLSGNLQNGSIELGLDLPMDEAIRASREKAMGFEPGYYHGSWADTGESFAAEKLGENTSAPSARKGFFFSSNPETASSPYYATPSPEMLNDMQRAKTGESYVIHVGRRHKKNEKALEEVGNKIYEYDDAMDEGYFDLMDEYGSIEFIPDSEIDKLRASATTSDVELGETIGEFKRLIAEKGSIEADVEVARAAQDKFDYISYGGDDVAPPRFDVKDAAANVTPASLRMDNPYVHDYGGASWRDESYAGIMDKAAAGGHDSVIFKNTYDGGKEPTDVAAVFNPSQIRSKFAAFDPRDIDSPSLLKGLAGIGVATGAATQSEQAEASQRAVGQLSADGQSLWNQISAGREQNAYRPAVSPAAARLSDIAAGSTSLLGNPSEATADWLNKLAYGDDISWMDRGMAALELIDPTDPAFLPGLAGSAYRDWAHRQRMAQ